MVHIDTNQVEIYFSLNTIIVDKANKKITFEYNKKEKSTET